LKTCGQHFPNELIVKEFAKKAPFFISKSPLKLAEYLTKNDSSDAQKVLNIYTWITHNIKYDLKAVKKGKGKYYVAKKTLRKRKGVCNQYAGLFKTLCDAAGISSREIIGYSKGIGYHENHLYYEADHSWNGVRIDGFWYLVDPTWGSGDVIPKEQKLDKWFYKVFKKPYLEKKLKFVKKPKLEYFFANPEMLITNHLPVDPNWQMVKYPVSLLKFENKDWKKYDCLPDTIFNKMMESNDYKKVLDLYEFKSNNQYNYIQGFNALTYNKRNIGALSEAYFVNATAYKYRKSKNPKEDVAKNDFAIKQFNLASSHAKKHKKSIHSTSGTTFKIVKNKLKNTVENPLKRRIKTNKKQHLTAIKRLKPFAKQSKNTSNKITTLKYRIRSLEVAKSKKKYSRLQKKRISRYENKIQIEKNNLQIKSDHLLLIELKDSIDQAINVMNELIIRKKELQKSLLSNNKKIDNSIEQASQMIIHFSILSNLSNQFQFLDSLGIKIDSLYDELKIMNDSISNLRSFIRQSHSSMNAAASNNQKLIQSNYVISKGKIFEDSLYEVHNTYLFSIYGKKISLNELLLTNVKIDKDFYLQSKKQLEKQKKILEHNQSLVDLYKKSMLGKILFLRKRSLLHMNKIINTGVKKTKKLRNTNYDLKREIILQKTRK